MNNPRGFGLLNSLLVVGSFGLVAWGGVYLGQYSGRFDGNEFDHIPGARVVASGPAKAPEDPQFAAGRKVFAGNCAACHGANGEGGASPGVPPLDGSEWVVAKEPGRLIRIVASGLQGPLKVKGADYNNNGMLAWRADKGGALSAEDMAAVLTYIRGAWSNKAAKVDPADVKAVWEATKARDGQWTQAELEKEPESLGGGGAAPAALTPDQLKEKLKALPADQLQSLLKELNK